MQVRLAAAGMILATSLVSCGGEADKPDSRDAGTSSKRAGGGKPTASGPVLHDPPLRFSPDGIRLGNPAGEAYAADGNAVYFLSDALGGPVKLTASDIASGQNRWSVPLAGRVPAIRSMPPAVGPVDGQPVVFVAFQAKEQGTGTTQDRNLLRVMAVDARSGAGRWTRDFDLQSMPEEVRQTHLSLKQVVSDGRFVAVSATGKGDREITELLDARTGRPSWQKVGFEAHAIDGDVLVGISESGSILDRDTAVVGLSATDGEQLWRVANGSGVRALGRGLVSFHVRGKQFADYGLGTHVAATRTGKPLVTMDGGHICHDDGQSTVICGTTSFFQLDTHVAAFDRGTGKRLWELPDKSAGRIAPSLITARRGVVYARVTRDSGQSTESSLILDARTGQDKVTNLPITPKEVVPGYALVLEPDLIAYRATG